MYVMQTKLTLRLDESLVQLAKKEATFRGTSVSRMVGEYFGAMQASDIESDLSPITRSFIGVMEGTGDVEEVYKQHLREKHL